MTTPNEVPGQLKKMASAAWGGTKKFGSQALTDIQNPAAWKALGKSAAPGLALWALSDLAPGLVHQIKKPFTADDTLDRLLDARRAILLEDKARQRRQAETMKLRAINMQMMAQYAPHLYNELSVGRKLPLGSTVIGGQPREDVLAKVADSMGSGAFQSSEGMEG